MGGMAEIFRARTATEGFEKRVCIKRILPHFLEDEEFVTMFRDEARTAAKLHHANCVHVFDFGEVQGTLYLAMELVDGSDLRRVLETARKRQMLLEVGEAVQIAIDMARGLHHAHNLTESGRALGVVHRDVSPHNVLVSKAGEVKVTDFGIARAAERATHTSTGVVKGKTAYMSPEQAQGLDFDHRLDQFATGVVLWEMLTGMRLFAAENDAATLKKLLACRVPPPSSARSEVPRILDEVVLRALSPDPSQRFPTMRDFEVALARVLYSGSIDANQADVRNVFPRIMAETESGKRKTMMLVSHQVEAALAEPAPPAREPSAPRVRLTTQADGPTSTVSGTERSKSSAPMSVAGGDSIDASALESAEDSQPHPKVTTEVGELPNTAVTGTAETMESGQRVSSSDVSLVFASISEGAGPSPRRAAAQQGGDLDMASPDAPTLLSVQDPDSDQDLIALNSPPTSPPGSERPRSLFVTQTRIPAVTPPPAAATEAGPPSPSSAATATVPRARIARAPERVVDGPLALPLATPLDTPAAAPPVTQRSGARADPRFAIVAVAAAGAAGVMLVFSGTGIAPRAASAAPGPSAPVAAVAPKNSEGAAVGAAAPAIAALPIQTVAPTPTVAAAAPATASVAAPAVPRPTTPTTARPALAPKDKPPPEAAPRAAAATEAAPTKAAHTEAAPTEAAPTEAAPADVPETTRPAASPRVPVILQLAAGWGYLIVGNQRSAELSTEPSTVELPVGRSRVRVELADGRVVSTTIDVTSNGKRRFTIPVE